MTDFLNECQRHKFLGESRGMLSQENVMDFNSLKSPYLGSESFGQDIGQFHSPRMKSYKSAEFYYF